MAEGDGYRDLKVWQRGFALTLRVYQVTASFPAEERFGLISQIRRCSSSIPANIAEGNGRDSTKDFLRHLSIASGSLKELETFVMLSNELRFLSDDDTGQLLDETEEISRMIRGLQRNLKQRLNP